MSERLATEVLRPGERVDMEVYSPHQLKESEEEKVYYITKIYDIPDDDRVDVLMPMEKMKIHLLERDMEFILYFYAGKGLYSCKARVVERYKEDQFVVAGLELTSPLEKKQRREYYRYSCVIGMNTRQLTGEEALSYEMYKDVTLLDAPEGKSVIVDISGGGIRFVTAENYEKGNMVYCRFSLKEKGKQKIYACVVRVLNAQPVGNQTKNIEYRGEFLFLDDNDREAIIRFIFEEERRIRRRM